MSIAASTTTSTATSTESRAGRPPVWAVLLPSLAFFMVTLDALVVVTALPSMRADLGGGAGSLQWIVNAYSLTFAAGIVTGAALGDRYGRKRVFLVGLGVFTLASAACALAPSLDWLVALRAVQGVGAAILTPVGLTLITSTFPAERRGAVVGLWGGISGLGVATGPLIGGAVTQGLDWHWIFWINVPVGLLALAGCARALTESVGPARRLDLPGLALAVLALAALVAGLVDAPTSGWRSFRTDGLLAVAAAGVAVFLLRERLAEAPMIPLRLFRIRVFTAAVLANLLGTAAIFSAAYMILQYCQIGRGYSPLDTGLHLLPWTVTPLFVAPLAGAVFDRVGARRIAAPGLLLQGIGFAVIVALAGTGASWAEYVGAFILAGIGISMALPSLPAAALSAVPPADLGAAAGVVSTMQRVGSVVGVAVIAAVFDANGALTSPAATVHGFRPALAVAAALSACGAVVALWAGGRARPMPRRG